MFMLYALAKKETGSPSSSSTLRGSRHLPALLLERQHSALECLTYPEYSPLVTLLRSFLKRLLLISPNFVVIHCG